jgi:hypothetical protein
MTRNLTERFAGQGISVPKLSILDPDLQCGLLYVKTVVPVIGGSFGVRVFGAEPRAIKTEGVEALVDHPP